MAAVVGLTVLVAAPSFLAPAMQYDGGISASSATFTLHGLLPYRDYWLLYGPLSGYALALPTAIFGPSVELSRIAGLVLLGVQGFCCFEIARRWTTAFLGGLIAIAAVVVPVPYVGLEFKAWSLAMTLALLGLYVLTTSSRSRLIAGVLIGLAFWSRLDVGVYALLAAMVLPKRQGTLLGFVFVAAPFALMTLLTTPVAQAYEQLIWYPLVGTRTFRSLPDIAASLSTTVAAALTVSLVVVPRILILVAGARVVVVRPRDRVLATLVVFAALCQLQTLGRADVEHLVAASTPAILLLAPFAPATTRGVRALVYLSIALVVASTTIGIAGSINAGTSRDEAFAKAVSALRSVTSPSEPIFVGDTRNRYTFNNPMLAYYLSDRAPGTRLTMYNPGVTNTDATQAEMVADLDRSGTRYLLLDDSVADFYEPQNSSRLPGSTILDAFIASNFRPLCSFGEFRVMAKVARDGKSAPCPDPSGQP